MNNKKTNKNNTVNDATKKYFNNIVNSAGVLSFEEEQKYFSLLKSKNEYERKNAKDQLVIHNQRLVVNLAQKYHKNAGRISLQDLIQEGQLGLFRAIEKFDPSTKFKFSTYAVNWIMQSITQYINEHKTLKKIPPNISDYINICNKNEEILFNKLGRKPSVRELSDYLIKYEQKENPKSAKLDFSVDKIIKMMKIYAKPISIDKEINYDSDSEVSDFISDENNILDDYEKQENRRQIIKIMDECLTPNEKAIICAKLGLDYFTFDNNIKFDHQLKNNEISEIFNISEEEVNRIYKCAVNKLKKSPKFIKLAEKIM